MNYIDEIRRLFKENRIYYPITQKELAEKTGVSQRTIARFEAGNDISLSNFLKLLHALGLDENLLQVIPEQTKRPFAYVDKEKIKRRATHSRKNERINGFKWGDEK